MHYIDSLADSTVLLAGRRFVDAEFMYRPRPTNERERVVFDYTLRSRLAQLAPQDAVLFICDRFETIQSLAVFEDNFPNVMMLACITNPLPVDRPPERQGTPYELEWEQPDSWQRMQTTDRWERIKLALQVGSLMASPGYLLMPAQDAVWGKGLLDRLASVSKQMAKGGLPAAVSPYTYHQHSIVPEAGIPQDVIDLLNTALSRDVLFPLKIHFDHVQAFWGKMSMTPLGMCGAILSHVDTGIWEDDLEIDRVIRELGYGVRCLWVNNPDVYRQALPVFDRAGLRKVIERTLHYSLNIPGEPVGGSNLNVPLNWAGQMRTLISTRFRRYNREAETMIAECSAEIAIRLQEYRASWLDWGAYRHVVRVGYPSVEVWKRTTNH